MIDGVEREPPYAALELHRDRVKAGLATFKAQGKILRDRFEVTAQWEGRAIAAPSGLGRSLARVGRAFLTGKSPRTRRGRPKCNTGAKETNRRSHLRNRQERRNVGPLCASNRHGLMQANYGSNYR